MKKVYICPETEVVKAHLAEHLLDHSLGWVDAKGNDEFFENEDEETLKSRNLWDE
jgi:hypothetical protein